VETITSRQNALVRTFRGLAARRGRRLLLEGPHLVADALAAGVGVDVVAFSARLLERRGNERAAELRHLADRLARTRARVVGVSDTVMAAMSPAESPSGVVAIAALEPPAVDAALNGAPSGTAPLVLLIADVQDPGNLGAIIRTAEAAGATGVVACGDSADPYGWKALRGAMGSSIRLPVAGRPATRDAVNAARARGLRIVATSPRGGRPLYDTDLRRPTALLVGGEGPGLAADITALADELISIPMHGSVESLNVAVSAALVLYEAFRQRHTPRNEERTRERGTRNGPRNEEPGTRND
jgi:TrmH family RNA methyltransferase